MVYCAKCGIQNDDDAIYCKSCGAPLHGSRHDHDRARDQRCEEECAGGKSGRGWAMFWGVIIILIGLAILFEVVLKEMAKTYSSLSWVNTVQWNWIFAGVIAIFIIIFGIRVISRK
jgi:uncharacterized membrane protein YvbJ